MITEVWQWWLCDCYLSWLVIYVYLEWPCRWSLSVLLQINSVVYKLLNINNLKILTYISISGGRKYFLINYYFGDRLHVESVHVDSMWIPCGVLWGPPHIQPKKKKLCGLHVESTWSPVEFMWSCGVHKESMGQGKVHDTWFFNKGATHKLKPRPFDSAIRKFCSSVLFSYLKHLGHTVPFRSIWRSLPCPTDSCRNPLELPDSGGIIFGRPPSQICDSGDNLFRRNRAIPELTPECSPECTGTECNRNPVPGINVY